MYGSSNSNFSQSLQQPSNVAMVASVLAHGILFTGLTLIPATSQQNTRKPLRVISLLQPSANQPAPSNQAVDPNAPPPAPGVAGLPLNITSPEGLSELPITEAPNPAFDPFASDILNVPPPPLQADTPSPFNPEAALSELPPPSPPPQVPPEAPRSDLPVSDSASAQADKEFEDWLNGTGEFRLPDLAVAGANDPSGSPGLQPNSGRNGSTAPSREPSNINSGRSNTSQSDDFQEGTAPPAESEERTVSYAYPQAACTDRLEGKAEYRIWVSPQGTPVVSSIVVSTNSDILDRAVNAEAKKYVIKPNDANKILVLPFDFKYSQADCKTEEAPTPTQSNTENPPLTPDSIPPTPNLNNQADEDDLPTLISPSTDENTPPKPPTQSSPRPSIQSSPRPSIQSPRSTPPSDRPSPATQPATTPPSAPQPALRSPAASPPTPTPIPVKPITLPGATPTTPANTPQPIPIKPVPPAITPPTSRPVTPPPSRPVNPTPPFTKPPPRTPVTCFAQFPCLFSRRCDQSSQRTDSSKGRSRL